MRKFFLGNMALEDAEAIEVAEAAKVNEAVKVSRPWKSPLSSSVIGFKNSMKNFTLF